MSSLFKIDDPNTRFFPFSSIFTPLERSAVQGGDDMDKISIPCRKGGVKGPVLSNGVYCPFSSTLALFIPP